MNKLSPTMQEALNKISTDEWESSYGLQISLSTLYALEQRGLIIKKSGGNVGAMSMPRCVVLWRKDK